MKVKLGIIGILIFVVIILPEILSNRNDQNVASLPNSPDYSESIGPQIKGPLPNGEKISLVQARTMTSYAIPLPELIEIKQVWASTNLETSEQSFAVEFGIDLLLIIHEVAKQPDWDGVIITTPELTKISVNGNPGVGTDPGFTKYGDKEYPYPGSVGWWVDGLSITLYSDTLSLDELLKIAKTIPYTNSVLKPTETTTSDSLTPTPTELLIDTLTPAQAPTDELTQTPLPPETITPSP